METCAWLWVKALSQTLHWYGRSPLWVLIWTVRCSCREHAFPQTPQMKRLMPRWLLTWQFRVFLRLKKRPHSEQPYGASSPLATKALLQTMQTNGFSLVCVLTWSVRFSLQLPGSSAVWKKFPKDTEQKQTQRLPKCPLISPRLTK
uniref:Secreted protein n=1 Tax=Acanthochromis polyacanthus TaxID=80966 RepID=A0A3Q1HPY4_9TELE